MATAYVLGTFGDPLEALHDFEGHAILVLLTGAEQDVDTILDRDTTCGINDEIPIFFPPPITAKAWLTAETTALLHVHCANPLDCPELDRIPIRSHGCNPPPNCIAEPDALTALVANPTCAVPTFLPPSSPTTRLLRDLNFGAASASAVAYDMSFENTTLLVNYVEFPYFQFLHWRADPDNPSDAYGLRYRGIVRVWESGTVQMVGELRFADSSITPTSLTELSYKVWFGETGQPGSLQTVATVPTDEAWYPVNWSGKPGALEHCEVFYGSIPDLIGDPQDRFELFQYSAGLVLPTDPPHIWGGSAGAPNVTACGLARNGNDIDGEWAITTGPFTSQHFIQTCEQDSTTLDAVQGFAIANCIAHLNASTLFGSLAGTFTRTIPDSATTGLRISIWTAQNNANTGTFDCGPWLRLAYAPTIQQGVDPIP